MDSKRPAFSPKNIWRLALAIIGIIAVVQELRKPADQRTWNGKVANFVPYDFRIPNWERVQDTYWNSDGPLLSGKVLGVGWAPNFGSLTRLFGK
ncbi:MAG TPA: hypothetical protein VLA91_09645 [Acidimicrobiia bacterium]|nr:hypothetical protein [Acidimicrobiia bacterium]